MPLIKVECSNCGGILSLDRDKGEAVCPFCNTPYILESVHIENATILRQPKEPDELVSDGVSFLRLKQYEDALDSFAELSRNCPKDWRGWYGKDIAKYFLHPEEGLMITAEEWELFPHKVRERKRRETEGRIGVLKAQIDAELQKSGFATLEDLFLSELERGS